MPVAMEQLMTREASDDRVAGMVSSSGEAEESGMNSCGAGSDGAAGTVTRSRSVAVDSRVNGCRGSVGARAGVNGVDGRRGVRIAAGD